MKKLSAQRCSFYLSPSCFLLYTLVGMWCLIKALRTGFSHPFVNLTQMSLKNYEDAWQGMFSIWGLRWKCKTGGLHFNILPHSLSYQNLLIKSVFCKFFDLARLIPFCDFLCLYNYFLVPTFCSTSNIYQIYLFSGLFKNVFFLKNLLYFWPIPWGCQSICFLL